MLIFNLYNIAYAAAAAATTAVADAAATTAAADDQLVRLTHCAYTSIIQCFLLCHHHRHRQYQIVCF